MCIHFHLKYTIKPNLGGEMGRYKANFHRLLQAMKAIGGLLGMITKSVRIILWFSRYFTGRLGKSEGLYFAVNEIIMPRYVLQ